VKILTTSIRAGVNCKAKLRTGITHAKNASTAKQDWDGAKPWAKCYGVVQMRCGQRRRWHRCPPTRAQSQSDRIMPSVGGRSRMRIPLHIKHQLEDGGADGRTDGVHACIFVPLNCNDGDGQRWAELTPRHCGDRCHERKKKGEKRRVMRGYWERSAVGSSFMQQLQPRRWLRYRKLRTLAALRLHAHG